MAESRRVCDYCGKKLPGKQKQFCSRPCADAFKKERKARRAGVICLEDGCSNKVGSRGSKGRCQKHRQSYCRKNSLGAFGRHKLKCPECGENFLPRDPTTRFCSMECYIGSEDFQTRIREQAASVNARKRADGARKAGITIDPQKRMTQPCLQCQKLIYVKPSNYKAKRFCGTPCYREYLAARFDRWVANPETIALPQCFDEFLTQEELPCLVEGCFWRGQALGHHVNMAHGITADEFREMAGFNRTTGLVTPRVARRLAARLGMGNPNFHAEFGYLSEPHHCKMRLEGREHLRKSTAMLSVTDNGTSLACRGCGSPVAALTSRTWWFGIRRSRSMCCLATSLQGMTSTRLGLLR